jgi:hypothetical protein
MGDGFFVSLDSHLDGIASALGIQRALAACTTSLAARAPLAPVLPSSSHSPQRRDRVRADRRVEVAHQQVDPPPLEWECRSPAGIRPNLDGPKSSLARRRSAEYLWPGISLYRSVCSWSGLSAARPRHGD